MISILRKFFYSGISIFDRDSAHPASFPLPWSQPRKILTGWQWSVLINA